MPIWHPHTLGQLVPHPTSGARLLASTLSSRCYTAETDGLCFKNLLYSSDFGETWRTLQEYVVMYDWARALKTHALEYPEDAVFAQAALSALTDKDGVEEVMGGYRHAEVAATNAENNIGLIQGLQSRAGRSAC